MIPSEYACLSLVEYLSDLAVMCTCVFFVVVDTSTCPTSRTAELSNMIWPRNRRRYQAQGPPVRRRCRRISYRQSGLVLYQGQTSRLTPSLLDVDEYRPNKRVSPASVGQGLISTSDQSDISNNSRSFKASAMIYLGTLFSRLLKWKRVSIPSSLLSLKTTSNLC